MTPQHSSVQLTPPPGGADADAMDTLVALVNVVSALQAITSTLPEPQANSVATATDGLVQVIGSMMKRHHIDVSAALPPQGTS